MITDDRAGAATEVADTRWDGIIVTVDWALRFRHLGIVDAHQILAHAPWQRHLAMPCSRNQGVPTRRCRLAMVVEPLTGNPELV
jgi:hypothetical protein